MRLYVNQKARLRAKFLINVFGQLSKRKTTVKGGFPSGKADARPILLSLLIFVSFLIAVWNI